MTRQASLIILSMLVCGYQLAGAVTVVMTKNLNSMSKINMPFLKGSHAPVSSTDLSQGQGLKRQLAVGNDVYPRTVAEFMSAYLAEQNIIVNITGHTRSCSGLPSLTQATIRNRQLYNPNAVKLFASPLMGGITAVTHVPAAYKTQVCTADRACVTCTLGEGQQFEYMVNMTSAESDAKCEAVNKFRSGVQMALDKDPQAIQRLLNLVETPEKHISLSTLAPAPSTANWNANSAQDMSAYLALTVITLFSMIMI